mmetsp:Transcript_64450/g.153825  ORF Transcript_64450/g.153825 Transcript_64450/m.153825 type:complete len:540 (+) Transcript_64450:144-1763(+)
MSPGIASTSWRCSPLPLLLRTSLVISLLSTQAIALTDRVDRQQSLIGSVAAEDAQALYWRENATSHSWRHDFSMSFDHAGFSGHGATGISSTFSIALRMLLAGVVISIFIAACLRRDLGERAWSRCADQTQQLPSQEADGDRVYFFDNARVLLQVLVVYGHIVFYYNLHTPTSPHLQGHTWSVSLYNWATSFHIEMFTLVSGIVAKGALNEDRVARIVERIVLPFMIIHSLRWIFFVSGSVGGTWWLKEIVCAPWSMEAKENWYLIAYVEWRILGALLQSLFSPQAMLIASYLISWFSGYWHDVPAYGLTSPTIQALSLLPFYVTGMLLPFHAMKIIAVPRIRGCLAGLAILILAGHVWAACAITDPKPQHPVFWMGSYASWQLWAHSPEKFSYFSRGAAAAGMDPLVYYTAWTSRLACQFLIAWPTGLSFLALVPQRRTFFSDLGQHAIYAYVLHPFFIRFFMMGRMKGVMLSQGVLLFQVMAILLSTGLTLFLMSPATRCWAKYIFEPTWIRVLWKERPAKDAQCQGRGEAALGPKV